MPGYPVGCTQADPAVTNTQRADAGLPVYSTTRNPVPVPTTAPMVHLEAAHVQQHVFRFTSAVDAHANVRPTGVKSIQIFGAFDTAPVTDSDFELLVSTTRMNATLNFPISDAGKSIWYRFRYLNTKDQPGPCPLRDRERPVDIRRFDRHILSVLKSISAAKSCHQSFSRIN